MKVGKRSFGLKALMAKRRGRVFLFSAFSVFGLVVVGVTLHFISINNIALAGLDERYIDVDKYAALNIDYYDPCWGGGSRTQDNGGGNCESISGNDVTWVGDSYTVGSKSLIEEALPGVDIYAQNSKNIGYSSTANCSDADSIGDTFADGTNCNIDGITIVEKLKASGKLRKYLVFALGTNQMGYDKISQLKEKAGDDVKIVVTTTYLRGNSEYENVNNKIKEFAEANSSGVALADWAAAAKDEYYQSDTTHPNDGDGFKVWVETITNALKSLGGNCGGGVLAGDNVYEKVWNAIVAANVSGVSDRNEAIAAILGNFASENGKTNNKDLNPVHNFALWGENCGGRCSVAPAIEYAKSKDSRIGEYITSTNEADISGVPVDIIDNAIKYEIEYLTNRDTFQAFVEEIKGISTNGEEAASEIARVWEEKVEVSGGSMMTERQSFAKNIYRMVSSDGKIDISNIYSISKASDEKVAVDDNLVADELTAGSIDGGEGTTLPYTGQTLSAEDVANAKTIWSAVDSYITEHNIDLHGAEKSAVVAALVGNAFAESSLDPFSTGGSCAGLWQACSFGDVNEYNDVLSIIEKNAGNTEAAIKAEVDLVLGNDGVRDFFNALDNVDNNSGEAGAASIAELYLVVYERAVNGDSPLEDSKVIAYQQKMYGGSYGTNYQGTEKRRNAAKDFYNLLLGLSPSSLSSGSGGSNVCCPPNGGGGGGTNGASGEAGKIQELVKAYAWTKDEAGSHTGVNDAKEAYKKGQEDAGVRDDSANSLSDCGKFVVTVLVNSGVEPGLKGTGGTSNIERYFIDSDDWAEVSPKPTKQEDWKTGDVIINADHAILYSGITDGSYYNGFVDGSWGDHTPWASNYDYNDGYFSGFKVYRKKSLSVGTTATVLTTVSHEAGSGSDDSSDSSGGGGNSGGYSWKDGWLESGIDGYTKEDVSGESLDEYPGDYTTSDGKPNKILLHYTAGGGPVSSGFAVYPAGNHYPAHFVIDLPQKKVWQNLSINKTSVATKSGDGTSVQIEIVGCGVGEGCSDDYVLDNFGDAEWQYLAKLLAAISQETGIPLTTSVNWSGDNVRMSSQDEFDKTTGIVAHMHAPGDDHTDTGDIWTGRLENALNGMAISSSSLSDPCGSGNGGSGSGGANLSGLDDSAAQKVLDDYAANYNLGSVSDFSQCFSLSVWWLSRYTSLDYKVYAIGGHAAEFVHNLAENQGVPHGSEPKVYSIFSTSNGGYNAPLYEGEDYGHTGIVVGINGDKVTVIEAWSALNGGTISKDIDKSEFKNAQYPGYEFAYINDYMKTDELDKVTK